jgi:secreted trypsin-like serine protease
MHSGASATDDQVNALTSALNLSTDQQAKVRTILDDQHQQAVNVVNDTSLTRDAKLQKIHQLRQSTIDRVRATLTSDEQKSKFDTMVQAQNDRIREREQQQQPQPNNTPPPK